MNMMQNDEESGYEPVRRYLAYLKPGITALYCT